MPQNNKKPRLDDLMLGNCKLVLRNFAGVQKKNNPVGQRNFCVLLSEDHAQRLKNDGWNVKSFPVTDPQQTPDFFLPIKVEYAKYPPVIHLLTPPDGDSVLPEEDIKILDSAELTKVNLVINAYVWQDDDGLWKVKAYLRRGYFTIAVDDFSQFYQEDAI